MIDTIAVTVAPPAEVNVAVSQPADVKLTIAAPVEVQVALSGTQGVSGPQGIQGTQGFVGLPATNSLQIFEFIALLDGAQAIPLPYPLGSGWYLLTINGVRQAPTNYTVAGVLLTLPDDLSVFAGDLIAFEYYTPTIY